MENTCTSSDSYVKRLLGRSSGEEAANRWNESSHLWTRDDSILYRSRLGRKFRRLRAKAVWTVGTAQESEVQLPRLAVCSHCQVLVDNGVGSIGSYAY